MDVFKAMRLHGRTKEVHRESDLRPEPWGMYKSQGDQKASAKKTKECPEW